MRRPAYLIGWALSLCAVAGCLNPMTTKLPQLDAGSAEYQRKASEQFDPFPDEALAPNTFSRPRGFVNQREPARKAKEFNQKRIPATLPGYPTGPELAPPTSDFGTDYPNVVRP